MGRYRFTAFEPSTTARYLVVSDMHRNLIEYVCLSPGVNLRMGMNALLGKLAGEGWTVEGGIEYGSVFVNRAGDRMLVSITERNPLDHSATHFNPFRRQ